MAGTRDVIQAYYAAFNAGDAEGMLALLADEVVHDINEGGREAGKPAFRAFLGHMAHCYREQVQDVVILVSEDGRRAAAEFTVEGTYLATDDGLPPARGQSYVLPAAAFFTLADGRITRVTSHYNLADWLRQIGD